LLRFEASPTPFPWAGQSRGQGPQDLYCSYSISMRRDLTSLGLAVLFALLLAPMPAHARCSTRGIAHTNAADHLDELRSLGGLGAGESSGHASEPRPLSPHPSKDCSGPSCGSRSGPPSTPPSLALQNVQGDWILAGPASPAPPKVCSPGRKDGLASRPQSLKARIFHPPRARSLTMSADLRGI